MRGSSPEGQEKEEQFEERESMRKSRGGRSLVLRYKVGSGTDFLVFPSA